MGDESVWSCQQASHEVVSGVHHLAVAAHSTRRTAATSVENAATTQGTAIGTAGVMDPGPGVAVGALAVADPTPALDHGLAAGAGTALTPETAAGPGTGPGLAPAQGTAVAAAHERGQDHLPGIEIVRGNALAAQKTEETGVDPGPPWRMAALRRMMTPMSDVCNFSKVLNLQHIILYFQ